MGDASATAWTTVGNMLHRESSAAAWVISAPGRFIESIYGWLSADVVSTVTFSGKAALSIRLMPATTITGMLKAEARSIIAPAILPWRDCASKQPSPVIMQFGSGLAGTDVSYAVSSALVGAAWRIS